MNYADELKDLTVRVAGGSGVLMRFPSEGRTFVLTAWHCIEKEGDDITIIPHEDRYGDEKITIIDKWKDEERDACIIEIKNFTDEIRTIEFIEKPNQTDVNCKHVGYPRCTEKDGKRDFRCHTIKQILDNTGFFVSCQHEDGIANHELKGMSGGGIFDTAYHLLGVHEGSACMDEDEQLGYTTYIPSCHFDNLFKSHGLSPVWYKGDSPKTLFNLDDFRDFQEDIFNFDQNKGAKAKLQRLLDEISTRLSLMISISPRDLYNAFQAEREGSQPVHHDKLKKEDWVTFGEFVVVIGILLGIDVGQEYKKIFGEYQFVQSNKDFDLYDIRNELDPKLIGMIRKETKIVVGGIRKSGYDNDVMTPGIPDIALARIPDSLDIATGGRGMLNCLTFINGQLFKDAMNDNCKEIMKRNDDDRLNFYITLLNKVING